MKGCSCLDPPIQSCDSYGDEMEKIKEKEGTWLLGIGVHDRTKNY